MTPPGGAKDSYATVLISGCGCLFFIILIGMFVPPLGLILGILFVPLFLLGLFAKSKGY